MADHAQAPGSSDHDPTTAISEIAADESLTQYADRIGRKYTEAASVESRREFAQYFTPPSVADFMASLCDLTARHIRILDAGAGAGILTCAICDRLLRLAKPGTRSTAELYEADTSLAEQLRSVLATAQSRLSTKNLEFEYRVITDDFILRNGERLRDCTSLFRANAATQFDIAISNPPYFKLSKADPRARAAETVVHGQPNIYALFMAVSAALLKPSGELIFITPRSFTSGRYFQAFREWFFSRVQPEMIHLFASRKKAFQRDAVLQENIVLKARRSENWQNSIGDLTLRISVSDGANDLNSARSHEIPISNALNPRISGASLLLPASAVENQVSQHKRRNLWSLRKLGLVISTGPVVPFRAKSFIAEAASGDTQFAPLLWMHHVKPMRVSWPLNGIGKPQYIRVDRESAKLLLSDRTYVLLRRFSAKEEPRRLIAAPLFAGALSRKFVGIENHVNYFHRPGENLNDNEAWGLAALLNSAAFDSYFRALSGHTQVNAAEINEMPFPSLAQIMEVGRRIRNLEDPITSSELIIGSVLSEWVEFA